MEINNNQSNQNNNQLVTTKSGISKERIKNIEKIALIEELIKCSICLEILNNPYECDSCGTLFCEDCIKDWIKIKLSCPMKCSSFKLIKAKVNTRKMLNLLQISCSNAPHCKYVSEYWNIFDHENKCEFQKIRCPNFPCNFEGHFKELKSHLQSYCESINYECGFCKSKIKRSAFEQHLDDHYKEKTFNILNCFICESSENLRRCVCKKSVCYKCLQNGKNTDCVQNCYTFQTGLKYSSLTYNISKFPLPKNFEVKILFVCVDWIRTGITFSKDIITDQNDANCPQYDIYCILEDLVQFYTKHNGWKNLFSRGSRGLKAGDCMTITLKNGELRYAINDSDLGSVIKIDLSKKKEFYLLIHARNTKSKAEIVYISEIFN
jgi:hypothetical protein